MEINPCMIINETQSECSNLMYNVQGFTIDTCSILMDAGVKYMQVNYGSLASNSLSFSMKVLSMTCTSNDLQTLAVKVLSSYADEAQKVIMVKIIKIVCSFLLILLTIYLVHQAATVLIVVVVAVLIGIQKYLFWIMESQKKLK